jgi:hypothetical protein
VRLTAKDRKHLIETLNIALQKLGEELVDAEDALARLRAKGFEESSNLVCEQLIIQHSLNQRIERAMGLLEKASGASDANQEI